MDFSSLPESQQQQLHQLHQQFQEHQLQHQQQAQRQQLSQQLPIPQHQHQDYASRFYDPPPLPYQDHDQSSYYPYYHYHQDPHHSHYPSYYPPDYAAAAAFPSNPYRQEGVKEASGAGPAPALLEQGWAEVQDRQSCCYSQGPGEQESLGLNPAAAAAVAALSQLTQFAGSMDAAERAMVGAQGRHLHGKGEAYGPAMGPGTSPFYHGHSAMHPPVGQFSYRDAGRRGAKPYGGVGRNDFAPHHPWSAGSHPPFYVRGRHKDRGERRCPRRFPSHGAPTAPHPGPSAVEVPESAEGGKGPSSIVGKEAQQDAVSKPTQVKAAPRKQAQQVGWCDLCRVDCNSMEVLEQHKNGKKHQKNLQRAEDLKNASKPVGEIQNDQNSMDHKVDASLLPENVHQGLEKNQILSESCPPETILGKDQVGAKLLNDTTQQTEIPAEQPSESQGRKHRVGQFDTWRRGMKRKMRGGWEGKRMKTFEAPRQPVEPPKPKVVIPLICDLCNVKCDTEEVLNRHLAGKKHIAKLKKFEDHQAMYGPEGLQALYPPNPIARALVLPHGHQQATYGPQGSNHPPGPYVPLQGHQAAPPPSSGSVAQTLQIPNPQGSEINSLSGSQAAALALPKVQAAV